ncbi:E3 ubiquitin-protein ligase rififylin [Venturia canescens]|uniref:E3 ubiquitin-protein ligase rififylin n=1 Tax=Venturia canescens TaxID=32260 RepID=UPI001C9D538C|nr:E3 ubiquitin-protein ligase rififylin [Venturia canescens]XP_043283383.1 E3 ubiquitin-protein ligase rififylin [Venturia canescens]
MENNLTYKFMLNVNGLIPNNIFDDMACEACSVKFSLFKRKKQCRDCMRFFCTDCVIKRGDRVLSCDNCSMLSRRPLVRSQVLKMRTKDLKHYLTAKKISLRGCVEKEDLINILMQYANGPESPLNQDRTNGVPTGPQIPSSTNGPTPSPPRRSRSPPTVTTRQTVEYPESEDQQAHTAPSAARSHEVEIEEVSGEDTTSTLSPTGPEPLVTEQDVEEMSSDEASNTQPSPIFTELPTWTGTVKLADITECGDLENLSVKQLKILLRTNRVDFKGCVERSELLDRATRLWEASKQSGNETEVEGPYDESLCKICWDSPIECVILECGHLACCIDCGKQMSECPICRQYVVRVVRFFKA